MLNEIECPIPKNIISYTMNRLSPELNTTFIPAKHAKNAKKIVTVRLGCLEAHNVHCTQFIPEGLSFIQPVVSTTGTMSIKNISS